MKYVDEFRDGALAQRLAAAIRAEVEPARDYAFMEFCGGHTHAISRYGVTDLLPAKVRMVHGPGCPVCVLPIGRIDMAISLALERPEVIVCSYGDCLRVPASAGLSMHKARARGADIRVVYSAADALGLARAHPHREVVFFRHRLRDHHPAHRGGDPRSRSARPRQLQRDLQPCADAAGHRGDSRCPGAGQAEGVRLDGFIGPAHVSTVIGSRPYAAFARQYRKPVVIAGFEPLDVMQAIRMLIRQVNEGRAEVENEFTRAVTETGNLKAQALVDEVFELRDSFEWRGMGQLAHSALRIRERFAALDAEAKFDLAYRSVADNKACECGAILRGVKKPTDCRIFGTVCTPENPMGSCMVSSEGACAAHYSYGRFRDIAVTTAGSLDA